MRDAACPLSTRRGEGGGLRVRAVRALSAPHLLRPRPHPRRLLLPPRHQPRARAPQGRAQRPRPRSQTGQSSKPNGSKLSAVALRPRGRRLQRRDPAPRRAQDLSKRLGSVWEGAEKLPPPPSFPSPYSSHYRTLPFFSLKKQRQSRAGARPGRARSPRAQRRRAQRAARPACPAWRLSHAPSRALARLVRARRGVYGPASGHTGPPLDERARRGALTCSASSL